jgi:hypothetical protein
MFVIEMRKPCQLVRSIDQKERSVSEVQPFLCDRSFRGVVFVCSKLDRGGLNQMPNSFFVPNIRTIGSDSESAIRLCPNGDG